MNNHGIVHIKYDPEGNMIYEGPKEHEVPTSLLQTGIKTDGDTIFKPVNAPKDDKKTEIKPTKHKPYKPCHAGNFTLMQVGKAKFMCGGFSKGATWDSNTVVIDLADNVKPSAFKELIGRGIFKDFLGGFGDSAYEVLNLKLQDYGVPDLEYKDWQMLADDIVKVLNSGHDVIIMCQMGHGRTGTSVSILMNIIKHGQDGWDDPVRHLREIYCEEAVDTLDQEEYVYKTLNLNLKPDPKTYDTGKVSEYNYQWWKYGDKDEKPKPHSNDVLMKCPICKQNTQYFVTEYGLCTDCAKTYNHQIKALSKESKTPATKIQLFDADEIDKGKNICLCGDKQCSGIYKCVCGHVVHGQEASFEDVCDKCYADGKRKK